jgi:hypothetical protein
MKKWTQILRGRLIFLIFALIFFGGVVYAYTLNDIPIMDASIAAEGICLVIYFVLGLPKKVKSKHTN